MRDVLELIVTILTLAASWRIFQKMGRRGWECIVPFYNTYVLFEELYGNGWRMLLILIPIYNIYSELQGPCVQIERIECINERLVMKCAAMAEAAVSETCVSDDGLVWSL